MNLGAPLGNLEGGLYTGDFQRWRRALGVGHLSPREFCEENLREGSFTVDPEGYAK